MANTLNFKDHNQVLRVFDLKGSRVGREEEIDRGYKPTQVLKDTNFLKISHDEIFANFMKEDVKNLNNLIRKDSEFLLYHGLMD